MLNVSALQKLPEEGICYPRISTILIFTSVSFYNKRTRAFKACIIFVKTGLHIRKGSRQVADSALQFQQVLETL